MRRIRICGHSHLAALKFGYRKARNPDVDVKFVPLSGAKYRPTNFSRLEDKGVRFVPDIYCDNFETLTGDTHIDEKYIWGFCMGGYPSRLDPRSQWQRCRPSPLWEPGKRPITLAQIDAVNESDQKATKNFVRNLKGAGARFFFIALPLSISSFYENDTESDLAARLFVKMRGRQKFQKWLKQEGVDFIDLPRETVGSDGFMRPEYMRLVKANGAKDYNHANAKYGELMMNKIADYAAKHEFD